MILTQPRRALIFVVLHGVKSVSSLGAGGWAHADRSPVNTGALTGAAEITVAGCLRSLALSHGDLSRLQGQQHTSHRQMRKQNPGEDDKVSQGAGLLALCSKFSY